jgi:FkbM family methyltransferase
MKDKKDRSKYPQWLIRRFQESRVLLNMVLGIEPRIYATARAPLEFHGNDYGGWKIVARSLKSASVVVDIGLGEDVSFSESIIRQYGCVVNGFDPTPRAIEYVKQLRNDNLRLFEYGIGVTAGRAQLYLPTNELHVSGALRPECHLGGDSIEIGLLTIGQIFQLLQCERIDLLKLDIEGTEYDLIQSPEFRSRASAIDQLCLEFHHRWKSRGKKSTLHTVSILQNLGFECSWRSRTTNEEFLFVRSEALSRWLC